MAGAGLFIGVFGLIFYLFILLLPVALLVALQVWLCRKNVKLGLILPGVSLALSLVMVLSMASFGAFTSEGGGNTLVTGGAELVVPAQEGDYIETPAQEGVPGGEREKTEFPVNALIAVGALFLIMNIPTAVFGGIWLHYKGRRDTVADLKKMQIEDLG